MNGNFIGFYLKTKNSQLNFFILMTSRVQELTKSLICAGDKKEKSKSELTMETLHVMKNLPKTKLNLEAGTQHSTEAVRFSLFLKYK